MQQSGTNLGAYWARAEHSLRERHKQPLLRSDFPPYQRIRSGPYPCTQSHYVIVLAASGQFPMAASGQIPVAVNTRAPARRTGSPPHRTEDGTSSARRAGAADAHRPEDVGTGSAGAPSRGRAPARQAHQARGRAPARRGGPTTRVAARRASSPPRRRLGPRMGTSSARRAGPPTGTRPEDGHRPGRRSGPTTPRWPGDGAEEPHQLAAAAPGQGRAPGAEDGHYCRVRQRLPSRRAGLLGYQAGHRCP